MKHKHLLMIFLMIFVISACSSEQEQVYSYLNTHETMTFRGFKTGYNGDVFQNPETVIFDSRGAFLDYVNGLAEESCEYYGFDLLLRYAEDLSESFFTDSLLVVVRVEEHSGSITHDLSGWSIEEDLLNLNLKRHIPNGDLTTDMAGWHLIVEMPHGGNSNFDVLVNFKP